MSDYSLYKISDDIKNVKIDRDIDVYCYKPKLIDFIKKPTILTQLPKKQILLWYLLSYGKTKIYYVLNENNQIIHYSFVIRKNFKFQYLNRNEYEIGPCTTNEGYRGKSIYPKVLMKIIEEERGIPTMIIHNDNEASIRGVAKCSFKKVGKIERSNLLHRWRKYDSK